MNPLRSRAGATLVEVLVALGIGVMIVAVVILAHQALTRHASRQSGRIQQRERAMHTLQTLRNDLHQLFYPVGETDCTIELENSATSLVRLAFCRWTAAPDENAPPTNRLERVSFEFAPWDGKFQLVQLQRPLAGPGVEEPPRTNWPGATWTHLRVQLHDGDLWQTNWPADAKSAPRAARIQLLAGTTTQPVHEAIVIIPAGLSVTSQISRAGTAGISAP